MTEQVPYGRHLEGSWRDCILAPFRPWVRVVYC